MEKILVTDDSSINRTIARMALEEKGYCVIEAEDGQSAIDKIYQEHPDLVLMDVMMPRLNGFEACKIIKNDPKIKYIPVIFVTALEELPSKKEGFEIGADDYITKPYIIEELLLRVELILRIKRERDGIRARSQEIAKTTPQLNEAQTQIIEKEKELLLRQIYVSLHHEIRNPLTTILIGSQVLESTALPGTSEKKIINEIVSCAKRIRGIMDSLGKMKTIVIDEYVKGTTMVHLQKSPPNTPEN